MGECSCICVPLISARHVSTGVNRSNNGLAPGMDVDVLDADLLLTLAAVSVQRFEKGGVGPRELVGLIEVLLPRLERLLGQHRPAVALHRGVQRVCTTLTAALDQPELSSRELAVRFTDERRRDCQESCVRGRLTIMPGRTCLRT